MDPLRGDVESSPLIASAVLPPSKKRDLRVLSLAFLLIFSAFAAAQNLQSTINTGELGTTSLGILYLSLTLFSIVGSPMVRALGSKAALVLGTTGYLLFIASNLKPSRYTMIPASVYLGYAASIIWVGQGTYLTAAARRHAKDFNLPEETVICSFNGEFWGVFATTQVIGNLVSLVVLSLRDGKEGESFTGATLLFSVFLGSITAGTILMFTLSNGGDKIDINGEPSNFYSSVLSLLKSTISPLSDKRMLLTIPLLTYLGLQQAFVWAEFTKCVVAPSLGVSGVGGAMAVYGLFDSIMTTGFLLWYDSGDLGTCTLFPSGSFTSGMFTVLLPLFTAALWGIGDGVFNTQLNALLGIFFADNMEAAFSQLKVWQSASTAAIFFASPYVTLQVMSTVMAVALSIAMACLFTLESM